MSKTYILSICFTLNFVVIFGQNKNFHFEQIPLSTISLNDSLFIDKTPVTNLMYQEFLTTVENGFWNLEKSDSIRKLPVYGIYIPRTETYPVADPQLLTFVSVNESLSAGKNLTLYNYFRHPAYSNHPVLQISKGQAIMFCKWRTDVEMMLYAEQSANPREREKFPSKITYRLPTEAELIQASQFFKTQNRYKYVDGKFPHAKYKRFLKHRKDKRYYTFNLSEYALNGSPVGGNWRNQTEFSEQNDYTGFRCVCEVEW